MQCNRCGKMLCEDKNLMKEDYIYIQKNWGYFSKKDGITQRFVLCEDCVEAISKEFSIPIYSCDTTELL